jgi:hypothetical protein
MAPPRPVRHSQSSQTNGNIAICKC